MFGKASVDRILNVLAAENRDLRDTLRSERAAFAQERQALVDRIMALTKPQAAAIVAPQPVKTGIRVAEPEKPRRMNFPGCAPRYQTPPYPVRAGEKSHVPEQAN